MPTCGDTPGRHGTCASGGSGIRNRIVKPNRLALYGPCGIRMDVSFGCIDPTGIESYRVALM